MLIRCRIPLDRFEIDIDVAFDSMVVSVFGPSGSGKTTLLDAIAGLREITSGEIEIGGRLLYSTSRRVNLPPQDRGIGYVPQEAALFPHLSVKKNILYGATREGDVPSNGGMTLEHVTAIMEIDHLLDRPVTRISGGECQRVALARAILSHPRVLLLDEPLASLDIGLKDRIVPYLRRARDEFGIPMIYVSHNATEVLSLADWVLVMKEGKVRTQGIPQEVLRTHWVVSQVAEDQIANVFTGSLISSDPESGTSKVRLISGQELTVPYAKFLQKDFVQIKVRGDDILIATEKPLWISAQNVLRGIIEKIESVAGQSVLKVNARDTFYVRLTPLAVQRLGLKEGKEVYLVIKTRSCEIL